VVLSIYGVCKSSPGTVEGTGSSDQKEMDVVKQEKKTKGFATNEENCKHVQRFGEDFVKERLIGGRRLVQTQR
jgi:hypothetical protein